MTVYQIGQPFPSFNDTNGEPLDNGFIYIGEEGKDPTVYPIQVYWDESLTTPAIQPLRTLNGYIVRNGTPSKVFTPDNFSILIRNSKTQIVAYSTTGFSLIAPVSTTTLGLVRKATDTEVQDGDPLAYDAFLDPLQAKFSLDTLSDLRAYTGPQRYIYVKGRTSDGDGGQGVFVWSSSNLSTEVAADALAGIYVAPNSDLTGTSGAWVRQWDNEIADPKWFGAQIDGLTDDYAAYTAAFVMSNTVSVPAGVNLIATGLSIPANKKLIGANWRKSILYYTGSETAVTLNRKSELKDIHITGSATADTTLDTEATTATTGTGKAGAKIAHVNAIIDHCIFSYFNNATLKSRAVEISGTVGFSATVKNCLVKFVWGGIMLKDINTDTEITANDIQRCSKFGISLGYDWDTSSVSSFTGDNFRIRDNTVQLICAGSNPNGQIGDGYGIYLARGSTINVEANYLEDVYAETGYTAYGVYADDESGGRLLQLSLNKNNIASSFSGTKIPFYANYLWYGQCSGNHFDSLPVTTANFRYFVFGENFFTGAPSNPYQYILGIAVTWYDAVIDTQGGTSTRTYKNRQNFDDIRANSIARAWVQFGDNGTTITVANAFNVDSITRNGNGDYTINFSSGTFIDSAYSLTGSARRAFVGVYNDVAGSKLTSSCRVDVIDAGGSLVNRNHVGIVFFDN